MIFDLHTPFLNAGKQNAVSQKRRKKRMKEQREKAPSIILKFRTFGQQRINHFPF